VSRGVSWCPGLRGLLTALSVVLFAFAFPGGPAPWLAWVALAPLFWALRGAPPRAGFGYGVLYGFSVWLWALWPMQHSLRLLSHCPPAKALALLAVLCLVSALPYALAGWLVCAWPRAPGVLGGTRDAAIFALFLATFPFVFPGSLCHGLYRYPVALQPLELGGVPLLSFLVYWTAWLAAETIPRRHEDGSWRLGPENVRSPVALLLLGVALWGYGSLRLQESAADRQAGRGTRIVVGAVQPNLPLPVNRKDQPTPNAAGNDYSTAVAQARDLARARPDVELIAFPESPLWFNLEHDTETRRLFERLAAETGKLVLLDAMADAGPDTTSDGYFNNVYLLDPTGAVRASFTKMHLVMGIEYWPYEDRWPEWLRRLLPESRQIRHGGTPTVFEVKRGVRVIPLVCYEGILSGHVRRFIDLGGNLIVNLVSDGWFLRSRMSVIHTAVGLVRAVEYRVPFVRVANSGISACMQASGEITPGSLTSLYEPATRVLDVFVPEKRSLYAHWGNWFVWLLMIGLGVCAAFSLARRNRV
jgi:apolipoprotein N-acyltransferase